jgi:HNH/ENDO VII superfamily nuclease
MAGGSSPFVKNAAGDWKILNLHHVGRQEGKMIEVFESYNRYNNVTGGPLHIPRPGSPARSAGLSMRYWQQRLQDAIRAGDVSAEVANQAGL